MNHSRKLIEIQGRGHWNCQSVASWSEAQVTTCWGKHWLKLLSWPGKIIAGCVSYLKSRRFRQGMQKEQTTASQKNPGKIKRRGEAPAHTSSRPPRVLPAGIHLDRVMLWRWVILMPEKAGKPRPSSQRPPAIAAFCAGNKCPFPFLFFLSFFFIKKGI